MADGLKFTLIFRMLDEIDLCRLAQREEIQIKYIKLSVLLRELDHLLNLY